MAETTYPVQSLNPGTALPVAMDVRSITGQNSAGIQWVELVDGSSNVKASVLDFTNSNPLAVAVVDAAGTQVLVHSVYVANTVQVVASFQTAPAVIQGGSFVVTVPSLAVSQANTPWLSQLTSGGQPIGTAAVTQGGSFTVTVPSLAVFQANTPWLTVGSQRVTQANTAEPFTVIVASTVGGGSAVTIAQSLSVFQGAPPWQVVGSQHVTQANTAEPFTVIVASTVGGGSAVTIAQSLGVFITSSGGPIAKVGSDAAGNMLYVFVASQAGGGSAVTATQAGSWFVTVPSLAVSQANTPWLETGSQYVSGTIPVGSLYTSSAIQPVPLAGVGIPAGTAATVTQSGTLTRIVTDEGGRLRIVSDQTSVVGTVTVGGTVGVTQAGSFIVTVPSLAVGISGTPTVNATQSGSWTVTVPSLGVGILGTAAVTQGGSFVVTVPSLAVFQANTPWLVTGSEYVSGTIPVGSIYTSSAIQPVPLAGLGIPAGTAPTATQSGTLTRIVTDDAGRLRIVSDQTSVIGTVTVGGTVGVTQAGSFIVTVPSLAVGVTGNVGVTQAGSFIVTVPSLAVFQANTPWLTVGSQRVTQANTAEPFTVIVASTVGGGSAVTIAESLSVFIASSGNIIARVGSDAGGNMLFVYVASQAGGGAAVTATQAGSWFVTVPSLAVGVNGNVGVTQAGSFIVTVPSLAVTMATNSPLFTVGSTWLANTPSVKVIPFNTGFMGQRITVAACATLVSSSTITANRTRIEFYNRGKPATVDSSAIVYLAGSINVTSGFTVWPIEYGAKLTLEAGPGISFYACTVGSDASNTNSGQELAIYELA